MDNGSGTEQTLPDEVDVVVVTMVFDATDLERLHGVLSKYVVLTRGHDGCRNVDYCVSMTTPGRVVIVQKWETLRAQETHFSSKDMVEMADACRGLLGQPPTIDLLEGVSVHDLA